MLYSAFTSLFLNIFQASGDTVLHAAVRKKDVDIAKILVECGCPVDLQNVSKETDLFGFQFWRRNVLTNLIDRVCVIFLTV